ncbi:hypothetical protein [Vibrio owensii]|uniref:hypothetical protein n=1 Tax=Vibrio owensii TaxID=696485 RepID=UPI00140427A2|nr:hypothetical protein [Vibrio owensii]
MKLVCPNCKFSTPAFENKQAVTVYWNMSNKPADQHALMMWKRDYKQQKAELQRAA